jgi:regulatory protein
MSPPPLTAERLEKAALAYLERFSCSTASLRRVLTAKLDRSVRLHGTERTQGLEWIEALIARALRAGLVDDALYAEARAASLRRRGASARAIRDKLAAKGVGGELVDAALRYTDEHAETDPDLAAAWRLARKRRLGPYRAAALRADHRNRDLAALGRAGFDYETARRVIDAAEGDEPDGQTS